MHEKNLPYDLMEYRVDYTGRTDGQPVYQAWGAPGLKDSENGWTILKSTYDGSNNLTKKQVRVKGIYDNRATYF